MSGFVVYDAGALVAADKNDRAFLRRHNETLASGITPLVPAPVLAQAWLPGGKHAIMHRVISGCEIISFAEDEAREVSDLCHKAGSTDVVDGFVAHTALRASAPVVTSDVGDIRALITGEPGSSGIVVRKP
jgi:hypothetical protein